MSQATSQIMINEVELDFSLFNPDDMQKYLDTTHVLEKTQSELSEASIESMEEYIALLRKGIHTTHAFFDGVFGDGTANRLFGASCDLMDCADAMFEFGQQIAKNAKNGEQIAKKYAPQGKKGK